mmetsp:Transcript_80461/g.260719  ORF Transcript_80461/g.260719 Transcript_80461/m.260719 type:complete len:212 (-) Transcript_80461:31-666(-)
MRRPSPIAPSPMCGALRTPPCPPWSAWHAVLTASASTVCRWTPSAGSLQRPRTTAPPASSTSAGSASPPAAPMAPSSGRWRWRQTWGCWPRPPRTAGRGSSTWRAPASGLSPAGTSAAMSRSTARPSRLSWLQLMAPYGSGACRKAGAGWAAASTAQRCMLQRPCCATAVLSAPPPQVSWQSGRQTAPGSLGTSAPRGGCSSSEALQLQWP